MSASDHSLPSSLGYESLRVSAEAAWAEKERLRQEEEARLKRRSDALIAHHSRLRTVWMYGAVLVPLLVMMMFGDEFDRALRGSGAIATIFTMVAIPVICVTVVVNLVIEVILDRAFDDGLAAIYPANGRGRKPEADRQHLVIQLLRTAAIVVPTALIWIFSGRLDRALASLGEAKVLLAIGVVVACWALMRYHVINRFLIPRYIETRKAALEAEWAAQDAAREAARQAEAAERKAREEAENARFQGELRAQRSRFGLDPESGLPPSDPDGEPPAT